VFELGKNALKIDSRQSLVQWLKSDNFINIVTKTAIFTNNNDFSRLSNKNNKK
jgi:hypothetical protein